MPDSLLTVLVVGATGSIGRLAVAEALRRGHIVRALVRPGRADGIPDGATLMEGDLADAATLTDVVEGIDAVVFTQGSHGGAAAAEAVDYGAVANTLTALAGRPVRIALMTAIGVTVRGTGHDWKRRGERLVRASGNGYTIVRPGWFDCNDPDQQQVVFLQGDTRRAGNPSDGVIARAQIAQVLIDALTSPDAEFTTFEVVAETGPAQTDLDPLFTALRPDAPGSLDGVSDPDNQPLDAEPGPVRDRLAAARTQQ